MTAKRVTQRIDPVLLPHRKYKTEQHDAGDR